MPFVTVELSGQRFGFAEWVGLHERAMRVTLGQIADPYRKVTFPIGPLKVQYDDLGLEYVAIDRPNDLALLEPTSVKPRSLSFSAVIADPRTGGLSWVEDTLGTLGAMAREDIDLIFAYGIRALGFNVRMTGFSYESVRRSANGGIVQAVASIELTERPARNPSLVSLAAIEYTPPVASGPYTNGGGGGGGSDNEDRDDPHVDVTVPPVLQPVPVYKIPRKAPLPE